MNSSSSTLFQVQPDQYKKDHFCVGKQGRFQCSQVFLMCQEKLAQLVNGAAMKPAVEQTDPSVHPSQPCITPLSP